MSIQHPVAENSLVTSRNSTLADAWLNRNPEAVEGNAFFSLAIEPDTIVEVTPDLKRHKWMHRQPITH